MSSSEPAPVVLSPDHANGDFSLAVLICTMDRPESLRRTLESLAAADRSGIALRVVVVNDSPDSETDDVVGGFQGRLPVCLVHETRQGKSAALNRGLPECGGAEIVAVVDDDITVDGQWFQGVRAITRRWPDKGYFAGSSFLVWPRAHVPAWARDPFVTPWAHSVWAVQRDRPIRPNCWASGNCFWFRASLLPPGYQFPDTWLTEPPLMLDLAERGFGGVISPDAKAWHHLTADLLDAGVIRRRAALTGSAFAAARLVPFRRTVKQAAVFHRHPILSRVGCALCIARWHGARLLACLSPSADRRFVRSIEATQKIAGFRQYLVSCRGVEAYRVRFPFSRSRVR